MEHALVASAVTRRTSRNPDSANGVYALKDISIPSMTFGTRQSGQASFVHVDTKDVISAGPVEAMDVLPMDAGLAHLMSQGALVPMATGFKKFRIVKTFSRFPSGLFGAHSVTFVLTKGVTMPGGDPGHSCVMSEETGQALLGVTCQLR